MNQQTITTKVYAIIWEAPYEGQRTLGIYSTDAAAQQALAEYVEHSYGDAADDYSVKELALNEPANWSYSEWSAEHHNGWCQTQCYFLTLLNALLGCRWCAAQMAVLWCSQVSVYQFSICTCIVCIFINVLVLHCIYLSNQLHQFKLPP